MQIYHCDGRLATSYSKYDDALGVKSVEWSPTGQLCAIGSFDEKVVLLNHLTWNPIVEFNHFRNVNDLKIVTI